MSIRLKRIIAFVIDWNIILLPFAIVFSIVTASYQGQESMPVPVAMLLLLLGLCAIAAIVARDVIFGGRSLGKRIFGLEIYENVSFKETTAKQRFLRNIFLFLMFFDGIVLLVTGETIGDRAAKTVVIPEGDVEEFKAKADASSVTKSKKTKILVSLFAVVLVIIIVAVAFTALIKNILDTMKDKEEYKLAYSYLIESDEFKKLGVEEAEIEFNQYSGSSNTSPHGVSVKTTDIGFIVNRKTFTVVCHNENGVWSVCEECTDFE